MILEPVFDGVHLFFPDPWPKKRHQKRRLVRRGITELIRDRMKPEGYLYAVTDWADYADQILEVLEDTPGLHNVYRGFAPRQPWRPATSFERKGLERNHEIYEVYFRRSV
jgi:tRNA (guanine-N7-)-methyltransferase